LRKTQRILEYLIGVAQLGVFFFQPPLVLGERRVTVYAAAYESMAPKILSLDIRLF
jgi:hypothetical protein